MPGYDRTGPAGMGPMTGGRRGMCGRGSRYGASGYGNYGAGRRSGRGFGRGYARWRGRFGGRPAWDVPVYPSDDPPAVYDEKEWLKAEAESLRNDLELVTRRLESFERQPVTGKDES